MPANDDEVQAAHDEGGEEAKNKVMEACSARQQCWVQRKRAPADLGSTRPNKRHRTGAKHFLQGLDNTVRVSTPLRGLSDFLRPSSGPLPPQWEAWPRWPHLSLAIDQGSDGLCGASWLRHLGLNISLIPDWSHTCHNDYLDSLKDMQLFKFLVLLLVPLNLEHGPFMTDARFNQVKQTWSGVDRHYSPHQMPLFLDRAFDMLEECGGDSSLMADGKSDDVDMLLWRRMVEGWSPRGAKVNLHRFFDTRQKLSEFLGWWSVTQVKYEFLAMQQGLLANKKLGKVVINAPTEEVDGEHTSTSTARVCLSEQALRGCSSNSLLVSVMVLGERWHYYLTKVIVEVSEPVASWHFHQNRELRNGERSHTWLVGQVEADFALHVRTIFGKSSDIAALQACGLALPGGAGSTTSHPGKQNDAAFENEDLADLFGELVMCLGSRRLARCSFLLRGWPLRMVGLCASPMIQEATARAFETDRTSFVQLTNQECKSQAMTQIISRSCFNDTSVLQYVQAHDNTNKGCPYLPRVDISTMPEHLAY